MLLLKILLFVSVYVSSTLRNIVSQLNTSRTYILVIFEDLVDLFSDVMFNLSSESFEADFEQSGLKSVVPELDEMFPRPLVHQIFFHCHSFVQGNSKIQSLCTADAKTN